MLNVDSKAKIIIACMTFSAWVQSISLTPTNPREPSGLDPKRADRVASFGQFRDICVAR